MFFRLKRAYRYWSARHDFAEVLTYLVAAKSFAHHNRVCRFHIVDDGSLTAHDHALLAAHLPGVTITPIAVHAANSPIKGGTWERLTAVATFSEDDYVVQLDSDTVTLAPLPEVMDCIRSRRSFALMSARDSQILPYAAVAERARRFSADHIQNAAEQRFDAFDSSIGERYAVATSAFAGFAPMRGRAERLRRFSRAMAALLQERWTEWGSEQVASNFLVGCDPQAILLPFGQYRNFDGSPIAPECRFVHFFGTYRFEGDVYRRVARDTAALLRAPGTPAPILAAAG
jgi:hypothetical protein